MKQMTMNIAKSDLEWIIEQLDCLEDWASNIKDEAYNCRKVIQKIIKSKGDEPNIRSRVLFKDNFSKKEPVLINHRIKRKEV